MNICMLVRGDAFFTPPILHLARALVQDGHQVDVFHLQGKITSKLNYDGANFISIGIQPSDTDSFIDKLINEFNWIYNFYKQVFKNNYSMFWAHNSGSIPWIYLCTVLTHSPWIYQEHELHEWSSSKGLNRIYLLFEILLIHNASFAVCPEPNRANILSRRSRLPSKPLVVRNTMPIIPLPSFNNLKTFVEQHGGVGTRIVLFHGGIGPNIHYDALIRSVLLWDSAYDLVLLGWMPEYIRVQILDLIDTLDLQGRVHLHPAIPHQKLLPYLSGADVGLVIYTNANLNEKYAAPNKLGEYLMLGIPVIYTACEGLDGLLTGCEFASRIVVPDPQSFASALNLFEGAKLKQAQISARKFAETEFNFEFQSRELLARVLSSDKK